MTTTTAQDVKWMEKNDQSDLGVYVSEYKGREYLHIREHYLVARTGERKPTKKGVALSISKAAELHALLGEVLAEAGALAAPKAKSAKTPAKTPAKSAKTPAKSAKTPAKS
jgi:hypothetical protein